ncbi:MAG TPA: SDR family NAD(P)-dependent oxidoreductase, partial [Kofleriaceae bacterium]|nr:SDR family NAD(P)-dependent oxidoreductase [Kofleriaceae bacterium]
MATWLITGAGRGIGLEMARQLRARGDAVIGTVRDEAKAGALRELGARVEIVDVSDPEAIERLGSSVRDPIDVLVNNAGVG